jgi:hypothetical protein
MDSDSIGFQTLDDRRVELERHRENSSRTAEAEGHFRSTGLGSIEFETRIDFGVTFVTKPVVSYGSEIDVDELEDVLQPLADDDSILADHLFPNGPNGAPMFPLVSGFVTDWDQDHKDFYTGAWCGVRVYYPPVIQYGEGFGVLEVIAPVVVTHHFRFSAVGMKDVPTALTD